MDSTQTKIRTLIVDDEPLARLSLSTLLADEPDVDVAGECGDGPSAAQAIATLRPDLVFLDVQMPAMSGLELLDALPAGAPPAIVFVTAHERFAVRAFDVQAVDYLLKPFRRERFHAALDRVRRARVAQRAAPTKAAAQRGEPTPDRLLVKCGDRIVFVRLDEIDYVRAAANYVQLHLADRVIEVREKISTMAARLPADRFLRIHRSYLVSLAAVRELFPVGGGEFMVALRSGRQLPVGPSYPPAIRGALIEARLPRFGGVGAI